MNWQGIQVFGFPTPQAQDTQRNMPWAPGREDPAELLTASPGSGEDGILY